MKKIILLVFIVLYSIVNAQTNVSRFLVMGHRNDSLITVDTSNFSQVRGVLLSSDSVIKGITGLARHPLTGVYYVMMRVEYEYIHHNRFLCTLNPSTGNLTIVGNTGDRFGNIVFLPSGKLLGVTGFGANTQNSLYYLDINDGHSTFIRSLSGGDGGQAIGYNPADGKIYHRGGRVNRVLEKLDTILFNATVIPQTGYQNFEHEVFGLLKIKNKRFLSTTLNIDSSRYDVITIDTAGFYSLRQIVSSNYKAVDYVSCTRQITGALTYCQSSSTTLSASASLGYQWYKNGVLLPGETNQTVTITTPGKYNCMFTDLCGVDSLTSSVTVVQNPKPVVLLTLNGSSSFCSGGSVLITGSSGGTSQWYKNGIAIPGATSNTYSATTSGLYNMIKTNTNGCKDSAAIGKIVTENPLPQITTTAIRDLKCFGDLSGSIDASASSGTAPYLWSNGNSGTTANYINLAAGSNTISVSDSKLCSSFVVVTINQPQALTASVNASNAICHGTNSGIAAALVNGGSGAYYYSWSTGGSSINENNLAAGSYSLTVLDDSMCTNTVPFTILQPAAIAVSFNTSNVSCNAGSDGAITALASGGTGSLSYSWSTGNTSSSIAGLVANTYSVVITDANLCLYDDSNSVTITEPTAITYSLVGYQTNCFGSNDGSAVASASGGTGLLQYSWSTGQNNPSIVLLSPGYYSIKISDSNQCFVTDSVLVSEATQVVPNISSTNVNCFGFANGEAYATASGGTAPYVYSWSTGTLNDSISGLTANVYYLTVIDSNLCLVSDSVIISEPSAIAIDTMTVSANGGLNNGSINITVSGGVSPYVYSWSNGATSEDVANLAPGIYDVTVTDAQGCIAQSSSIALLGVGIQKVNYNAAILLYPNPNNGRFQITTEKNMHLMLFNSLQQSIIELDVEAYKSYTLNQNLAPGIYYLKGFDALNTINYKIVVEK